MKIHQFATSLTYGDAISDEMLEIQAVLREKGFESDQDLNNYQLIGSGGDFKVKDEELE